MKFKGLIWIIVIIIFFVGIRVFNYISYLNIKEEYNFAIEYKEIDLNENNDTILISDTMPDTIEAFNQTYTMRESYEGSTWTRYENGESKISFSEKVLIKNVDEYVTELNEIPIKINFLLKIKGNDLKGIFKNNNIENEWDLEKYIIKSNLEETNFFSSNNKRKESIFILYERYYSFPSDYEIYLLEGKYEGVVKQNEETVGMDIVKDGYFYPVIIDTDKITLSREEIVEFIQSINLND